MPDLENSEQFFPAYSRPKTRHAPLSAFLSFLAFQGDHIRIGLEISAVVLLFFLFRIAFPWGLFATPSEYTSLASWFAACLVMIVCDQGLFRKPVQALRRARNNDIQGNYDHALHFLDILAPNNKSLINFPAFRYHLERARVFIHALRYGDAETELERAKEAGLSPVTYHLTRSTLFGEQEQTEAAMEELESAKHHSVSDTLMVIETALLLMEKKKDYRAARGLMKTVLQAPDLDLYAGGMLKLIVLGYFQVSRLWTGEAEEGIEGLTDVIYQIRGLLFTNRDLRPYLAFLLLERSYYWATHKEPNPALTDLKLATHLCAYPKVQKRSAEIRHELEWRYNIRP